MWNVGTKRERAVDMYYDERMKERGSRAVRPRRAMYVMLIKLPSSSTKDLYILC